MSASASVVALNHAVDGRRRDGEETRENRRRGSADHEDRQGRVIPAISVNGWVTSTAPISGVVESWQGHFLPSSIQASPTPIDHVYRFAYRVAHRLLRVYWTVRRPRKGGTLVAIWHAGQILIVKNTYRKEHTLPGGYPRHGETPPETGARELEEECGLHVRPADVRQVYQGTHLFEGRDDDVTIVEVELATPPVIRIDPREIAFARLAPPEEVLGLLIVPHLREYLEQRAERGAGL